MTRTRPDIDSTALRSYAMQQTRTLLRRLAFQINHACKNGDADAVHDLRVAIRRFSQCLRVFDQYFPDGQGRKIRRKLKTIMHAASGVRDRDIAVELMTAAGIARNSRVVSAIAKERKQAERQLVQAIRQTARNNFSRKWWGKLGL